MMTSGHDGFTLLELLIAILLSSVVAGAIFVLYTGQTKVQQRDQLIVNTEESLRSGMMFLTSEIRDAGYDPTENAGAGIVSATSTKLYFTKDDYSGATYDTDGDGNITDNNEHEQFSFTGNTLYLTRGASAAQIASNTPQTVIGNVENLEFYYTLSDGTQTLTPTAADLSKIRAVSISLLIRSSTADSTYVNSLTYTTASGAVWGPYNDHFIRRFLTTMVYLRNMRG